MKKRIAMLLLVTVVLSFALPVFAVGSVVAPKASPKSTADVPVVVKGEAKMLPTEDLTEEQTKEMETAFAALKDAVDKDVAVRYFCYATADEFPCEVTLKIDNVKEATVLAFIDGEWVEIEVTDNGDGTYTFELEVAGPIAVCTK